MFLYALVVLISSCGGNKTQSDNSGTHTHTDGTVHQEGDHEEVATPEQESFVVESDSTEVHDHNHDHEGDGDHDHQH